MCFSDVVSPRLFRQQNRRARKQHKCCECKLPIRIGDEYEETFGVWDGDSATHRTCLFCVWLRERLIESERAEGCRDFESHPGFGYLYDALSDGHYESIGLVRLEMAD